ncbi:MAG: imidazole glycerol phosphate synthase subunit HisF [Ruminococcaceae bacterium]|nr:imidazole glycerol phosphate synthase subunit HisF [Oscillospiraceae bacterium]
MNQNYKRIIPCLDVKNGRVVKGVRFEGVSDVSSPVDLARYYCENGVDELVFYDIAASVEGRKLFTDILFKVMAETIVPLTVGGGLSTLEDCDEMFKLGAAKVSINSGAIKNPNLITEVAEKYGSERVIISADVSLVGNEYHVFCKGGMEDTGMDAIEWISRCVKNGAGEVVLNSIDMDGVKGGFDLPMLDAVCNAVDVPVIASGGAGKIEDFVELFKTVPKVDAGLAASVFHFKEVKIPELKKVLKENGINVRTEV